MVGGLEVEGMQRTRDNDTNVTCKGCDSRGNSPGAVGSEDMDDVGAIRTALERGCRIKRGEGMIDG